LEEQKRQKKNQRGQDKKGFAHVQYLHDQ